MSAYAWVGLAAAAVLVSVALASIIVIARAGLWINRDLKRCLSSVDPIERAQRRYEASPFKTTPRTWDELTPEERRPWLALVAPACADSEDRLY